MSLFTTIVGGKLVIGAFAVGSVVLGGTAAVACTGSLPTSLQEQAHSAFGAPAPQGDDAATPAATDTATPEPTDSATPDPTASATPDPSVTATPDPTDSATPDPTATDQPVPAVTPTTPAVPHSAHGLCVAYSHGGLVPTSVAYTTLVTAAGSAAPADITAWCAQHLIAPGHLKHPESDGSDDSATEQGGSAKHEGKKHSSSPHHSRGHGWKTGGDSNGSQADQQDAQDAAHSVSDHQRGSDTSGDDQGENGGHSGGSGGSDD